MIHTFSYSQCFFQRRHWCWNADWCMFVLTEILSKRCHHHVLSSYLFVLWDSRKHGKKGTDVLLSLSGLFPSEVSYCGLYFFLSGFYLLVHLLSFITCDLFSIPFKGVERWHKTLVHVFILRSPFVTSTFLCEILSLNFASWQFWVLYKVIIDNCWPFWPFRTTLYTVLIVPYLRTLIKT